MRFNGGGMNMTNFQKTYQDAFFKSSQGNRKTISTAIIKQNNGDLQLTNHNSPISGRISRIHVRYPSLPVLFKETIIEPHLHLNTEQNQYKEHTSQKDMQTQKTRTLYNETNGSSIFNIQRPATDRNSVESQRQKNLDQKTKRILSQQSKRNFLQFLLVQKAGKTNDMRLLDFFKKEYGYQLPVQEDKVPVSSKKGKLLLQTLKKGIHYLSTMDESEKDIKDQVNQVIKQPLKKGKSYKDDKVPLDEYIKFIHEDGVRSLRKLLQMQKEAEERILKKKQSQQLNKFQI